MTPVPIHTVVTTPPPAHADPTAPQNPGSPQATPNDPGNQHHPNQDSLDDIRADLDHYPGGLTEPDPADQQALADAVPRNDDGTPERFPDPHGPWSQLQNDGGNTVPGRSNNCADCSRSFLETWYGNPQVSAPRTVDTDANGNPDYWSPEDNANDNQIRWTGASHAYAGPGGDPNTANNIASVLQQSGPGSAAIVQVDWPGGGGHAFNVVNHDGNIVWIDTQSGDVSDQPLHLDQAEHVWHIPLDANRNPIDLSQPDATDSNQGTDTSQEGTDTSQDGTDTTQDGSDTSQEGQDTSQQEPDDNSNQSSDDSKPGPETAQQDPQTAEDGPDTTQQKADDSPDTSHSQNQNQDQQTNESDPSPETTDDNPSDNSDATKSESPDTTQSESPDSAKPTDPEPSQTKDPDPTQSENPDTTQTGNPDSNPHTDPDSTPPTDPDSSPPSTDPDASEAKDPDAAESTDPDHTTPEDSADGSPQDPSHPDPLPATATRDTTPPGGVTHPTPAEQQSLENSVPRDENGDPTRPPDPADGPWVRNINGDGADSPGRNNNCTDVALSTVDTYAGNPTAAAARTPDPNPDGTPSDRGEKAGRDRIENTLGARFSDMGNGRGAFNRLENTLRNSGHGSQAVIITQDANGRAHAWNAVNHNGRVTYIDAQTGQQSSKPLHNGNNGVFAIPLDSNRQPVAPDNDTRSRPATERKPDGQTPETRGSTDRRVPQDPAGATPEGDKSPERPRGSAEYESVQGPKDTHYDMLPEPSQAHLRESNEVRQTDLRPVYDNLKKWSTDGDLRALLHDGLAAEQGGIRKQTLIDALPGFGDMTEGQQGAVVAALARMDLRFHATSSVGIALDPNADNPNSPTNFTPTTDDPEKIERSNKARETIQKLMDKAGIKSGGLHYHNRYDIPNRAGLEAAIADRIDDGQGLTDSEIEDAVQQELKALEEHKGDWSRKNYAVVEVRDPENNNEIRYVVDSSLPMSQPWGSGVHSEPHAMDWINSVNEGREAAGQQPFEPISLYTEREPCGHASGNDCSDYLANEVEDGKPDDELSEGEKKNKLRIHYGVGFRRGAIDENADLTQDDGTTMTPAEAKDAARVKFKADFNNYVNRVKGIWENNAKSGQ
ncbi:hypothetical protein CP983_11975 [Streptomyces chartreusis]|nr:hypothetical protein CP983_11975 [Streptomyces chartreusis]